MLDFYFLFEETTIHLSEPTINHVSRLTKLCSYSTQMSMKFELLIKTKMLKTIAGILTVETD